LGCFQAVLDYCWVYFSVTGDQNLFKSKTPRLS
jgi:hypothetical protein